MLKHPSPSVVKRVLSLCIATEMRKSSNGLILYLYNSRCFKQEIIKFLLSSTPTHLPIGDLVSVCMSGPRSNKENFIPSLFFVLLNRVILNICMEKLKKPPKEAKIGKNGFRPSFNSRKRDTGLERSRGY